MLVPTKLHHDPMCGWAELGSGGGGPTRDGVACMWLGGLARDGTAEFLQFVETTCLEEKSGVSIQTCPAGDGVLRVTTWSVFFGYGQV